MLSFAVKLTTPVELVIAFCNVNEPKPFVPALRFIVASPVATIESWNTMLLPAFICILDVVSFWTKELIVISSFSVIITWPSAIKSRVFASRSKVTFPPELITTSSEVAPFAKLKFTFPVAIIVIFPNFPVIFSKVISPSTINSISPPEVVETSNLETIKSPACSTVTSPVSITKDNLFTSLIIEKSSFVFTIRLSAVTFPPRVIPPLLASNVIFLFSPTVKSETITKSSPALNFKSWFPSLLNCATVNVFVAFMLAEVVICSGIIKTLSPV